MSKLYTRGLGAMTRLLLRESLREKLPQAEDVPQDEAAAPPTTSYTTPVLEGPPAGASRKSEAGSRAGTGCLPCALNHASTCAGLLSEALRFARSEGMGSEEVVSRAGLCTDELNALERIDLRAEKIAELPPGEKELAHQVLVEVRGLRHQLENLTDAQGLEDLTAKMQGLRTQVGKEWWKLRLSRLTPEQRTQVALKAAQILEGGNDG